MTEAGKNKDGSLGLSYPMLTRENYTAWALKMKVYMQAHAVWGAIESSDSKTTVNDRTDKIALAAIYQGIPEDILLTLAEKKTAKEAWEAVKTICQGADRAKKARVQTLKADFESMNMKETDSLDEFYLKMNGIVANIRALGESVEESYVVKKILRAVPGNFLQIASTIEQFGNLETMTVEETIGSLKAHEERLRGQTESGKNQLLLTKDEWIKKDKEEEKLLLTREEWQRRSNKAVEGSQGQRFRGKDNTRWGRDKSRVRCFNCNAFGHYASECKKPKRDKEAREEALFVNIPDDEPTLLLAKYEGNKDTAMLINEEKVTPKLSSRDDSNTMVSNLWYLDNGASNHMTGQRSKFSVLDESVTGKVKFGDDSMVEIKGKGSIELQCKNGESRTLADVYYIPSLCNNIISLGQLSEEGYMITLSGVLLWVRDNKGVLIMKVKRSTNRLYKIILQNSEQKCLLAKGDEDNWLWHSRLGHVNFNAMIMMSTANMVHGLPKIGQPKGVCTGCLMAKQTRKGFPQQAKFLSTRPLELIHGDLCGPINPITPGGNRYIFLLVDDYSRFMWFYLLKNKSDAFEAFKKFRVLVEKNSEKGITTFRTDRGGEFLSKEFLQYCEEAGITRQFTAPYSPQQNGVVERRNRTMIEMARSLLKERNLPINF